MYTYYIHLKNGQLLRHHPRRVADSLSLTQVITYVKSLMFDDGISSEDHYAVILYKYGDFQLILGSEEIYDIELESTTEQERIRFATRLPKTI